MLCGIALSAAPSRAQTEGSAMLGFQGGIGWLNSSALTPADLRGKVVLVDFWEYTCINCLHTLPYLREWYKRYHDLGFTIVGVHTPEFAFSGDEKNVTAAIKRLGVTWPVVLDSRHVIWDRYHNTAWPHELLYDQNGKLIESVIGEGNYQVTEKNIQTALRRRNPNVKLPPLMALLPQDSYTKPGSVCYPQTSEILTGPEHTRPANANAFDDLASDSNYVDRGGSHRAAVADVRTLGALAERDAEHLVATRLLSDGEIERDALLTTHPEGGQQVSDVHGAIGRRRGSSRAASAR